MALEPVSKFPGEPSALMSLVASWEVATTCGGTKDTGQSSLGHASSGTNREPAHGGHPHEGLFHAFK